MAWQYLEDEVAVCWWGNDRDVARHTATWKGQCDAVEGRGHHNGVAHMKLMPGPTKGSKADCTVVGHDLHPRQSTPALLPIAKLHVTLTLKVRLTGSCMIVNRVCRYVNTHTCVQKSIHKYIHTDIRRCCVCTGIRMGRYGMYVSVPKYIVYIIYIHIHM